MAMIFTLVSVALDWLTQNHEEKVTKAKEEKERKQTEAEEAERKRFEGTRVTVETFMAWKAKFDAEMAELKRIEEKKREAEGKNAGGGGGALTGKELFAQNADLDDSDIKFLGGDDDAGDEIGGGGGGGGGAGGGGVEVDETLFQDLEDLDFDDDDDEDFDPDLVDDDDED